MRQNFRNNQRGRTMIEAIGYIMIMILVTIAATALVNSGLYHYRLGRIDQELTDLKKVISQRYVASKDYSEVKLSTLCEEGIGPYNVVPSKKDGCNSKGVHSFGGNVEVGNDDDHTFFIKFDMLPTGVCTELGSKIWVINDGSDLDWMEINKTTWKWKFSDTERTTNHELPANVIDVLKACNAKGPKNEIIWHFN